MVKREHSSRVRVGRTKSARVLSALLLALILYGTTVEAAHRHGRIFPVVSDEPASSVSDFSAHNERINGTPNCTDCLICQLHQNFSSILVNSRELDSPTLTGHSISAIALIALQTQYAAPRRGRSPPQIS